VAYYAAGRRIQKNFRDKAKAKRTADQILRGLTLDANSVDSLLTPDLESLVVARKALTPNYALHVARGGARASRQQTRQSHLKGSGGVLSAA